MLHENFGITIGHHDHRPLVHERSGDPRPAAQGPAPRPRGGAVDDPDDDRRGEGRRPGAAGAEGKFDGISVRVPTPNVSLVDLTFQTEKPTNAEEINQVLREAPTAR